MSADYAVVIYWYVIKPLQAQSAKILQLSNALRDQGYGLFHESNLDKLCQSAGLIANAPQHSLFVLVGNSADISVATVRLRAISELFGIVSMLSSQNEAAVTQALLCGADNCINVEASSPLLLAGVGSVLRRMRSSPVLKPDANEWLLLDEAWTVLSPGETLVSLTTLERTFFQALADAPHYKVSHFDLLQALSLDDESQQHLKINRLGVIVSRLRRKFKTQGLQLPLKSVHNWGYMFAAPLLRR